MGSQTEVREKMETELVTWKKRNLPHNSKTRSKVNEGRRKAANKKGDHARDFIAFAEARKK